MRSLCWSSRVLVCLGSPHQEEVSVQDRVRFPHRTRRRWVQQFVCLKMFTNHSCSNFISFFFPSRFSLGGSDHAGPSADPRTDRHAAPGATAEHPHPQRADPENCQRGSLSPTETLRAEVTSPSFLHEAFCCY